MRRRTKFREDWSNSSCRYCRFSNFQDGRCPPSWIGFTRVGTTHEEYLVVFVAMQILVVIGAEIATVCNF